MIGHIVRGGVYYASLPGAADRNVLVVSWDAINNGMRSPIVCQVTRTERERSLPTYVRLAAGEGGVEQDSYVLCHELVTVDAERFRRELGVIPPPRLVQVEEALMRALDLPTR